jgi:hypothetical protein
MARRLLLPLLATLLLLTVSAPARAATLTAAGTLLDPATTVLRAGKGSCARTAFTPPIAGFLTVRSTGGARSDWDLVVQDKASGRRIAASQAFGSREVVQTWVQPGGDVLILACRRSGPARSLRVTMQLLATDAPAPEPASLVRVSGLDRAGFERLEALGVDVTHNAHADYADVVATPADATRLTRAGFRFTTRIPDLAAYEQGARAEDARYDERVGGRSPLPSGRTTYRVYEDYQSELKALAERNPGLVRAIKLPKTSFQGRELSGVEIAEDVGAGDGRPEFLLVAVHHAREWPAAEAAMEFAHLLVQGRGKDPRIDRVLRSTRTVIVPLINPDGFISSRTTAAVDPSHNLYENGQDVPVPICGNLNTCEGVAPPGGVLSFRRKNCDGAIPSGAVPCELQYGVDPNRNYGQFWGGAGSSPDPMGQTYRGTGPWSEPETQAVHEWSQVHPVTTLITLHNVAALVLRPPGTKDGGLAPDEAELKRLGDAMGAATGYRSQYGYQLYDTSGTTEDWNYAAAGTFGYTIEMGPKDGEFHMPYEVGTVGQWDGMREALLLAAEDSSNAAHHSVIGGRAPAGRTLRLQKAFTTPTKETCSLGATGAPFNTGIEACAGGTVPAQEIPDKLEYTTVVPASGVFDWHVTPSTRPFVAKAGRTEAWTLSCEDGGKVVESRQVVVPRGQAVQLDLPCGGTLPALAAPKGPSPAAGKTKKKAATSTKCSKARKRLAKKRSAGNRRAVAKACKKNRKAARRKAARPHGRR